MLLSLPALHNLIAVDNSSKIDPNTLLGPDIRAAKHHEEPRLKQWEELKGYRTD